MSVAIKNRFLGWWRPDRRTPWTRLARGETNEEAWGALLDALTSVRGGESIVLRGVENPNIRRQRPEGRRR
jgi:hypothetical protein